MADPRQDDGELLQVSACSAQDYGEVAAECRGRHDAGLEFVFQWPHPHGREATLPFLIRGDGLDFPGRTTR